MAATSTRRRRAPAPRAVAPSTRVERFFARHLRHLTGEFAGAPFKLDPWQRDEIIAPIFDTVDRRGFRRHREALIGVARGNGKSPLAAGVALFGLYADGEFGAECYSLAASKPQARIVFGTARDMVNASPMLRAASKVYKDAIEVPETGSVYRVLSSVAELAHGLNPHVVTIDELHAHRSPDLYEAVRSALHKRRQPLLLAITTAGFDRQSICYRVYERGMRGDEPRLYFRWWQAPDDAKLRNTKAWREANPGSWLRIADLRDQLRALPEPVFRRLHLNQWTSGEATWIAMADWDACDEPPDIPAGAPVWIGVDAAPKRDTTAVVVDHRDDDGVHHWIVYIFEADRAMGYLDYAAVEDLLRELAHTFDVQRILVDPFTMMRSMIELAGEGLPIEEYPQNDTRMVPASQALYDVVLERRLRHGGNKELRLQAASAAARETARGWRLHKLRSTRHIDAVVAGAMAAHIAEQDAERAGANIHVFDDDELDELEDDDAEG